MDVVIILLVILILIAFAVILTRSSGKKNVEGGYNHRVILDKESIKAINALLNAIEDETHQPGFLLNKAITLSQEERRKDSFYARDYANDQQIYPNGYEFLKKHPEITEEELMKLSDQQMFEDRDFANDFIRAIRNEEEYHTDNPIHQKVMQNPVFYNFRVDGDIDLSEYDPLPYIKTDPNDENRPLSRLFEDKTFDPEGFQIKHRADNNIQVRQMSYDENVELFYKACCKLPNGSYKHPYIQIKGQSVNVDYPDKVIDPSLKMVSVYKGVTTDKLHDIIDNKLVPFALLTKGYELLNDTRGYASGYGLYTSPNIDVAISYAGGVLYRFKAYYKKYFYSFIDEDISDETLRWLTDDFDPKNIEFPTTKALQYWYVRHPEIKDLKAYFYDYDGTEVPRFKKYLKDQCPGFTDEPKRVNLEKHDTEEERDAREKFYDDHGIDLIVSYTHGSNMETYYNHHGSIQEALREHRPSFETVSRPGSKILIDAIIAFNDSWEF